jgi:hypothetical protein
MREAITATRRPRSSVHELKRGPGEPDQLMDRKTLMETMNDRIVAVIEARRSFRWVSSIIVASRSRT